MSEMRKLYNKTKQKSTKSCAVMAREKRRNKAISAFSIKELLQHFDLYKNNKALCPKCSKADTLKITHSEFSCTGCKQKGNSVKVVALAKSISYWKAIYYIEDLRTQTPENPQLPVKKVQPPLIKSSPKTKSKPKPKSNIISEQDLEMLKQNISIKSLVEQDGVKLKKNGKDLVGLCPFHPEKSASLSITPSKNLWNCFGCQKGGSVVDWVMYSKKIDFVGAIDILRFNHELASIIPQAKAKPKPQAETIVTYSIAKDQQALQEVIDYYNQKLKTSPVALAYLEKRGIAKAVDEFRLGFCDRTLGIKMAQKKQKREELQRLGIIRDSGHEHFNGSVVIPVVASGKIGEVYGRKINDNLRQGTSKHLYLPGAHVGVFNRKGLGEKVIITEALIDALSFWVNGFRNVTSSYGTSGFTDEIHQALLDARTKQLFIAYDNDESGNKAAQNLATRLANDGIECLRILFPQEMDANSFACEKQNAQQHFAYLIENAKALNKPALASQSQAQNHSSLAAKQKQSATKEEKIEQYRNISLEHKGDDVMIRLCDR